MSNPIVTYIDPHLPYTYVSQASNNANSIIAFPGQIGSIIAFSVAASPRFLKFYDKATAPNPSSDIPVWVIPMPGYGSGGAGDVVWNHGLVFQFGIAFAIVAGMGVNDNTAIGLNDCVISVSYR